MRALLEKLSLWSSPAGSNAEGKRSTPEGSLSFDSDEEIDPEAGTDDPIQCRLTKDEVLDNKFKMILQLKLLKNDKYRELLAERQKLPVFKSRSEILRLLETNQVLVISGETGMDSTGVLKFSVTFCHCGIRTSQNFDIPTTLKKRLRSLLWIRHWGEVVTKWL